MSKTVKPDTRKRALYGEWQADWHLLMVLLKPHEGYVFHKAQKYEEYILEKKKKEKFFNGIPLCVPPIYK